MGVCMKLAPGNQLLPEDGIYQKMKTVWGVLDLNKVVSPSQYQLLEDGKLKNLFIFGEDPIGCAINAEVVEKWFSKAGFVVVQDYFLTDTAQKANLILPASLPVEIGGSFTNTQRVIQEFEALMPSKTEKCAIDQLTTLLNMLGCPTASDVQDILAEAFKLFPIEVNKDKKAFILNEASSNPRLFNYGCDHINKIFVEEFEAAF
jgi:predicted molibdopterin-dependent oxidoreductase YjgC